MKPRAVGKACRNIAKRQLLDTRFSAERRNKRAAAKKERHVEPEFRLSIAAQKHQPAAEL